MATQPVTFLTPEQYLEIERAAERKSEYFGGEMFAMAGATERHNLIAFNTTRQIGEQLRSRPCRGYAADMRVHTPSSGLFTYPDIVVACGEPKFLDDRRDTLLNPTALIEILSPSTEAYDRGRKFEHYRSIGSLRQYVLIAQDRISADLYTRQINGQWLLGSFSRSEDVMEIDSIQCRLFLAECYEKVEFNADLTPSSSSFSSSAPNPSDPPSR